MAFKEGEDVKGKGLLLPVFVGEDGNMYNVQLNQEKVDALQMMIPMAMGGSVTVIPKPINTPEETVSLIPYKEFLQE
jgi:hypothetical protein